MDGVGSEGVWMGWGSDGVGWNSHLACWSEMGMRWVWLDWVGRGGMWWVVETFTGHERCLGF